MTEPDDAINSWTGRLNQLGVPPDDARKFVHDLYAQAQTDLDEQRAEADFEREE